MSKLEETLRRASLNYRGKVLKHILYCSGNQIEIVFEDMSSIRISAESYHSQDGSEGTSFGFIPSITVEI